MDIIYYDLRKAFDKVYCGILVAKEGWYEPDEWVTNWVKKISFTILLNVLGLKSNWQLVNNGRNAQGLVTSLIHLIRYMIWTARYIAPITSQQVHK